MMLYSLSGIGINLIIIFEIISLTLLSNQHLSNSDFLFSGIMTSFLMILKRIEILDKTLIFIEVCICQ